MSKFKAGMIIENADGERKILGQCGEVFFISEEDDFETAVSEIYTEKELRNAGFEPIEEPWKPEIDNLYAYIGSLGDVGKTYWSNSEGDKYHLSIGNVFPPENNEELIAEYKRKLQEIFKPEAYK